MKICGITAEYNPLHNGHLYHMEQARAQSGCDVLIAVMSGNFVQRGEPAIIDKWERAEAAVKNGIDAVIELPYTYATQSASVFAHGAVHILKLAGADSICFGSECGNLENLMEIAETSVNPDHLRELMNTGLSYPKAYSLLTSAMAPNDILAVSYLKEIMGTGIVPIAVQRTNDYLDDEMSQMPSALAIRKALGDHRSVEGTTPMAKQLEDIQPVFWEQYYPYLRTLLLTCQRSRLRQLFLVSEGIEVHLKQCAKDNDTWQGFLRDAITYRYTAGRIRRTCLSVMMQLEKEEQKAAADLDTLRILAFNDKGRMWLKELKEKEVRTASRFAQLPEARRELEYRAALVYTSVMDEESRRAILKKEISGARFIKE